MPDVSKIGDIGQGVCPCHRTPVSYVTSLITGASTVNTNGLNTAYIGSVGIASCGHPTAAMTGSPNVNAMGAPVHRVGDIGQNCGPYSMMTGSANVKANDNG